jgi:hypothetical protein
MIRTDGLIVSLATSNTLVKPRQPFAMFPERSQTFKKLEYLVYESEQVARFEEIVQRVYHVKFSFRLNENFTAVDNQILLMSKFYDDDAKSSRFYLSCEITNALTVQLDHNLTPPNHRKIGLSHTLEVNKWYQIEVEVSEKVKFKKKIVN